MGGLALTRPFGFLAQDYPPSLGAWLDELGSPHPSTMKSMGYGA